MAHPRGSGPVSSDDDADSSPASPGSLNDSIGDITQSSHPGPTFFASPSSPEPLASPESEPAQSPPDPSLPPRRVPSLRPNNRTVSDPQTTTTAHMSSTSSVSGTLSNARRPTPSAANLPQDVMQKARALQQQRMAMSPHASPGAAGGPLSDPTRGPAVGLGGPMGAGMPPNMRMAPHLNRNMGLGGMVGPGAPRFPQPGPPGAAVPGRPGGPSLSERRAMKLGGLPGNTPGIPARGMMPKLSDLGGGPGGPSPAAGNGTGSNSRISDFKHYIDTEKGWITFEGAATITRTGVNFAGGHTFKISLDELQVLDELGKGNYGTVYKVRHAKPAKPRFGPGLSGFKRPQMTSPGVSSTASASTTSSLGSDGTGAGTGTGTGTATTAGTSLASITRTPPTAASTGKVMAMKEIRLELDEAKFTTILKELVILHECVSPYIIDFYGAFYQEGAVYMCIEYMDGGSIDKLYAGGIPESVLRKITYSAVMGLKSLKDEHNIIHRDVKPTNILVNTCGHAKICDFGVSGNLVASIAKTNIGCQSYMAPERISGGTMAQATGGANTAGTYSVQSDIWSLGLTIIECAMGRYPYPPEVSSTIFGQLTAIVNGDPPVMPDNYSATAHNFVRSCLEKNPQKRHTYSMLLEHAWLKPIAEERKKALKAAEEDAAVGAARKQVDAMGLSNTAGPGSTDGADGTGAGAGAGDSCADGVDGVDGADAASVAGDAEVAAWVSERLERMQHESESTGTPNAGARPALHNVPSAP